MTQDNTLSVRSKILLTVVVSILLLSVAIYAISTQVLLKSYLSIEEAGMVQDLRRATDAIGEFSNQQTVKLQDWAQWDDSYNYAKDRNPEFLESAMLATGLQNLDINAMAYLDLSGEVIAMMVIDIPTAAEVDPARVRAAITGESDVATHESLESRTQGLLMLTEGPLIVSSLPLRTTDGGGPSTGSIVFARYLDPEKVAEIGEITHLSIDVFRFDATDLPEDVADARAELMRGEMHMVEPVSSVVVRGYTILNDLNGNPALIVRVDAPRPIYAQGQLSFILFMTIGGIAILLFGIVMYLLLERLVISRFVRLSKDVEKINDDKDLSIRVEGGIKDEIGKLAEKINQMLKWLSEAREAEAASRREIINLLDEQKKAKEQKEEMERILAGKK